MGFPQTTSIISFDDYLAYEREEEARHEYFDGMIYAMAGESLEHSTISANLIGILHGQFCVGFIPLSLGRVVPAPATWVLALFGGGGVGCKRGVAVHSLSFALVGTL